MHLSRQSLVLALAVLVALAGCSALSGPTATPPEPRDLPGTGTPTVERLSVQPPGVTDTDVNETRLLGAHYRALEATTWREHLVTRRDGAVATDVTVVRNGTHSWVRRQGAGESLTYVAGNATARRVGGEGNATYRYRHEAGGTTTALSGGVSLGLVVYFTSGAYSPTAVEQYEGDPVVTLVARGAGPGGYGPAYTAYNATALVDERGVVRSLRGAVRTGEDDPATRFSYTAATDAGPVQPPDWLDTLPQGRAALVADGRVLRVTLAGGPRVPAGTTVTLAANGTAYTVSLDVPAGPGDTLYLGVTEGRATVSRSLAEATRGQALRPDTSLTVPASGPRDAGRAESVFVAGE